ncbi:MAG: LD-carboxypeptidase [Candidatus Woesebacteria bacterium]|nr:LD-carboxypeptidase [Candidatus Woesebacteria bacterium]
MFPEKLKVGDEVRVIAPAHSLSIIAPANREISNKRFTDLGLKLSFGQHVEESNVFESSSIESRIADLHDAFRDKNIKAIFAVIGGFNSNQLLRYIDWDLIRQNPKILCGYSDITALGNAIFAKTGLVNYSGPAYSTCGQQKGFEYSLDHLKKCLMSDQAFAVESSPEWSDDKWYLDQENRNFIKNEGFWPINDGRAKGTIIGGNLCTLNLLQGTEYMPSLKDSILFLEDDYESKAVNFDRDLQSLIHQPDFGGVRGIVIGRFQKASEVSAEQVRAMIKSKKELADLPMAANVDFGHTDQMITFPIGGEADMEIAGGKVMINILKH